MKQEYTQADFARGVKNPYFLMMHTMVQVPVTNDVLKIFSEVATTNNVSAAAIMGRCLEDYARRLVEQD